MCNKITNNISERSSVTYPYCYFDNCFTEKEVDQMCSFFSQHELQKATVVNESEMQTEQTVRKSKVKFFYRDDVTYPIFDKLNSIIETANDRFYNFILNGYDMFQYTEYDASDQGQYNFHMDTILGNKKNTNSVETRKLSLVICLNRPNIDFEGGQFYINEGAEKDAFEIEMKKGRIIFFPSFVLHRVAPVTKGKRKSLVIWVMGPKFR